MQQTSQDPRSMDDLLARIALGTEPDYLLFWGPQPAVEGTIDASCLCNWYPARFVAEGIEYPTTEHYMMAEKARLFGDHASRELILSADTPLEAKAVGRRVADFEEEHWARHRLEIVVTGLRHKFRQHRALGAYLAGTAPRVLVEASPWDALWGIGLDRANPKAADPRQWKGQNLLGFALMRVREELKRD